MRKTLVSAASVFAILAGTALAQNATPPGSSQGQAPAATAPAPAQPTVPPEKMGNSVSGQQPGQAAGGTAAQKPPVSTGSDTTQKPATDTGGTAAQKPSTDETGQAAQQQTPPAGAKAPETQAAEAKEPAGPPLSAKDIMGQKVYGSDGKSLGSVSDAVVDSSSGKIEKLVISSGGFLGIGAKLIALDLSQVKMAPAEGIKANDVTQSQVQSMPEFDVASATQSLEAKTSTSSATGAAPMGGAPAATSPSQ
jgi:sporulation protein YlmC with PRC-barrel domain